MNKRFCISVLKNNKLFSGALFLIFTLVMSLLVMLVFFYPSVSSTFDTYMSDYCLAEGTLLTSGSPRTLGDEIAEADGVKAVAARVVSEQQTILENGKTVSLRYQSVPENDFSLYYNTENEEVVEVKPDSVMVSAYFARKNDIHPGSILTVKMGPFDQELTVTDLVSCPETICVARSGSSWYDNADYAYIYVGEDLMDNTLGCVDMTNRIDLLFEENADQSEVLEKASDLVGTGLQSATLFENSSVDQQIKSALDSTKAVATYLPALLAIMGVLFSTLFMSQIIRRSQKQIGLLRALGYTVSMICRIFIQYSVILTTFSAVIGSGIGILLLRQMLMIYKGFYDLPYILYSGNFYIIFLLIAAIISLGVISCLFCSKDIASVDPASVYGGSFAVTQKPLPRVLANWRTNSYSKISFCAMYRNKKRFFITVCCNIACLILTFLSVSILFSKSIGVNYLFKERFLYDLSVCADSTKALNDIAALPETEKSETGVIFDRIYENEVLRFESLPENPELTGIRNVNGSPLSISQNGVILEEGFARRHNLTVGDVLVVDDISLTVSALSREYFDSTQYISLNSAKKFGYDEPNTLFVVLKSGISVSDYISKTSEIEGYSYFLDTASREICALDTLNSLDAPCYMFILFGIIIGAVIIANMNLITVMQRRREYATLLILGTPQRNFYSMAAIESALQYVCTVTVGIPIACALSSFILTKMSSVAEEYILENIPMVSLVSCSAVLCYLLIGIALTGRTIRKLDPLSVLGEKE